MRRLPTHSSLVLCATLALAGSLEAGVEPQLDDRELAPLGRDLAAYFAARESTVGLDGATAALTETLARLQREVGPGHPLGRCADLGRAFWLSRGYANRKQRAGKVLSEDFPHGAFEGGELELAYRLPEAYDATRAYPLLLLVPDEGESPAGHIRANWALRDLLSAAILVCPEMPSDTGEWDRVQVNGRPGGLSHVLSALRIASERFAVDFDRVFVVGRGKGVPAALAAGNYAPQRFAGVVGRAGDVGDLGPENFENLPTYFAGGGSRARAFHAAATGAGLDNCLVDPGGKEGDVWRWLLAQRRRASPRSLTLVPGDPFPTRAYWLRVAPCAPVSRTRATVERDANTIRIETVGTSQVTLYLNDILLDLDQGVRIVCNGIEHSVTVPRHLPTALDLLHDGTSDAACAYVAEAVVRVGSEAPPTFTGAIPPDDHELRRRLRESADDAGDLWALYEWCESNGRGARAAGVLRRLLRGAPDHEAARAALGHRRIAGRWFPSEEARTRFGDSQDEGTARAKGHVSYRSIWMHPEERAFLTKGLVKDHETGQWLSAANRKAIAEGWVRQDLEWIPPEEAGRADVGLWRVDGEWVDLEQANRRRSRVDRMWRIPGDAVVLCSTADRDVALRAQAEMSAALEDLRRVFGAEPRLPLSALVLRDEEQYDRFAFGDPDGRRPATHRGRLHVVHRAFFAESWFPLVDGERIYRGMGVCYWDPLVPNGDLYGVHSARLAAGLSYVEALDPSPKSVRKATTRGPDRGYYDAFRAEKALPDWLRFGAAVYAERFFADDGAGLGGDRWWARRWSLDNLRQMGGRRPLSEILAFPLDPEDREDGLKLLIEAGLLVAFLVDGSCAPVTEAHAAFKKALAAGRLHPNHLEALTEALLAHEAELGAFPGT